MTSIPKVQAANSNMAGARDVSNAEQPLTRDVASWQAIVDRVRSLFPIPRNSTEPFADMFLSIDHAFPFESEPLDDNFRYYHVEPLLDQAADLLDRGLRERAEYADMAVKRFNLGIEMEEYLRLDEVHQREIEHGFYTLPYKESYPSWQAELVSQHGSKQAADNLSTLLEDSYSEKRLDLMKAAQTTLQVLAATATYSGQIVGAETSPLGRKETITQQIAEWADLLHKQILHNEKFMLELQRLSLVTSSEAATQKASAAGVRAKWALDDVNFRRDRTQIARDSLDCRMRAATEPGGALNFSERMAPLKKRFGQDFRYALARLSSVEKGMKLVYGYEASLPQSLPPMSGSYFDECLIWVRDAINWLVRFSRMDQNYMTSISLRQQLKPDVWANGLKAGTWPVEILDGLFPDQQYVRLRGVGASVVLQHSEKEESSNLWMLTLRVPQKSKYRHSNNREVEVDQSNVPPCRLGRVATRVGTREPDITGASALHNVSPLGVWTVSIGRTSTTGMQREELNDIIIDLHLAVRSA